MVIVIIGPSGSGKDTQANFIVEKYQIPNISTGRIMRDVIARGDELGQKVDSYISSGKWLPDDLTFDLLVDRLAHEDCKDGFILNGFPRTAPQIELLDKILEQRGEKLVGVVHFRLDEAEIFRRMNAQKSDTEQRPDTSEEAIRARLKSYNDTVQPILDAFAKRGDLIDIDASGTIQEIRAEIENALQARI